MQKRPKVKSASLPLLSRVEAHTFNETLYTA